MSVCQLIYQTKRGAGVVRYLPATPHEIERALSAIKRPARLMLNGQQIGEIWENDGSWGQGRRVDRWVWSYCLPTTEGKAS